VGLAWKPSNKWVVSTLHSFIKMSLVLFLIICFFLVLPTHIDPEDGGSKFLRKAEKIKIKPQYETPKHY
jgi:hypothetical protein